MATYSKVKQEIAIATGATKSGKNLIINGAMQVAQRGTSFSSITSSTYTLDRFAVRNATAVSQSTDVPTGQGFKNSLFYDNDGTRGSINVRQVIEDATRLLNDTPCTLSFWIKGSISASCSVDLADTNLTGFSITTSWTKHKITFPATSNLNSGNTFEAGAVWVDFNFGASYPDVYLTGVQLELGEQATPFEHRSYGEELALCQRYYYQPVTRYYSGQNTTGGHRPFISFPCTMRSAPTTTLASVDAGTITQIWTGAEAFSYEVSANRPKVGDTSPFKFDSEL